MRAFTVSCQGGDVRVDELRDVEAAFRTLHEACFQEDTAPQGAIERQWQGKKEDSPTRGFPG